MLLSSFDCGEILSQCFFFSFSHFFKLVVLLNCLTTTNAMLMSWFPSGKSFKTAVRSRVVFVGLSQAKRQCACS